MPRPRRTVNTADPTVVVEPPAAAVEAPDPNTTCIWVEPSGVGFDVCRKYPHRSTEIIRRFHVQADADRFRDEQLAFMARQGRRAQNARPLS